MMDNYWSGLVYKVNRLNIFIMFVFHHLCFLLMGSFEAYFVLIVIGIMIYLLFTDKLEASWVFIAASIIFVLVGIISIKDFMEGFANEAIATIFVLIFMTGILQNILNINSLVDRILKSDRTTFRWFFLKFNAFVAITSSVINNAPIVAFFTPYLYAWGEKNKIAPSKLLMPLSFAAIMGGMITLFGTSTNLVLNGLIAQSGAEALAFTDFLVPGLLVTVVGLTFLATIGLKLLPDNTLPKADLMAKKREYIAELQLAPGSTLVGKTISEAGLRNLDGVFLVEIIREGKSITPVRPEEKLQNSDILFFAGDTEKIIALVQSNLGLVFPKHNYLEEDNHVHLVEAMIPANSRLAGKTLKETGFRNKYNAAILAIHRNGERLMGKLGEIVLKPGDMLFLSAGQQFYMNRSDYNDLYVFSEILPLKDEKKKINKALFLGLMLCTVVVNILIGTNVLITLISLLVVFALAGFTSIDQLKNDFDPSLLMLLVGSLAVGLAMLKSGAAEMMAMQITEILKGSTPIWGLLLLYGFTVILTSFITNVAAVSIAFPITYELIHLNGWPSEPFYLGVAFAASAAFMTSFGYQTNLMIAGPGKYKSIDFFRLGFPLTIVYSTTVLIYLIFAYGLY